MTENPHPHFDDQLDRLQQRLPGAITRVLQWLRRGSRWVRIPIATVLIAGGIFGFLPVLGFWMIPLGLLLLAQDLPPLRSPIARLLAWVERKFEGRSGQRSDAD